ncbi:HlyD family efflux transporter periplasmic adaptor subunit [Cyanobacteria bacterium FACHB-63]|nr:HlyD family efflux transporter periplasmic adaptor subunit [Cyanobacteria bacterium FACHB-63]
MVSTPKSSPEEATRLHANAVATQWSLPLQTVLDQPPSNLPSRLILGGTTFCLLFAVWSWYGHTDEVAQAKGKLIPKGEVFQVHSIDSGKVVRIAVQEGQTVEAGQVLMELDTELAEKEVHRLEHLLQSSEMEKLQTQDLLDKTRLQAETRAAIAKTSISMQEVAITQSKNNAESNQELLAQFETDAHAQEKRLERLKPLVEQGAISQENVFTAEQQLRDRTRSITERQNALEQTQAEARRLQIELAQKKDEAQQSQLEAQQEIQQLTVKLTELQAKVKETGFLLEENRTKLKQRFLRSPAKGVVLSLNVRRSGVFTQPGQTIAEIAPQGQPLVISAILPSAEMGFVKPGLPVKVKLDAYPYQDYGIVPGRVSTISPDSKPNEQFGQSYRVEVALDRDSINAKGQTFQFKPGQTAVAEIVTRQRRVADVLLDPLKKLQNGANL